MTVAVPSFCKDLTGLPVCGKIPDVVLNVYLIILIWENVRFLNLILDGALGGSENTTDAVSYTHLRAHET